MELVHRCAHFSCLAPRPRSCACIISEIWNKQGKSRDVTAAGARCWLCAQVEVVLWRHVQQHVWGEGGGVLVVVAELRHDWSGLLGEEGGVPVAVVAWHHDLQGLLEEEGGVPVAVVVDDAAEAGGGPVLGVMAGVVGVVVAAGLVALEMEAWVVVVVWAGGAVAGLVGGAVVTGWVVVVVAATADEVMAAGLVVAG